MPAFSMTCRAPRGELVDGQPREQEKEGEETPLEGGFFLLERRRKTSPLSKPASVLLSWLFKSMRSGEIAPQVLAVALGGAGVAYLASHYMQARKEVREEGVKVCILGTGWGINVQVPQFRRAGLKIVALFSRSPARGKELADSVGIPLAFSSTTEACSHPEVELVSIVTPVYLHVQHFSEALEGGKHVLLDKPMCRGGEGDELLAIRRAHPQQVVVVDHELRFTPSMLRARQLLREGAIGQLRFLECRIVIKKPVEAWSWWDDKKLGGGCFGAFGSHMIDSMRFMLDADVEAVSASLESLVTEYQDSEGKLREATSDDYASCQFRLVPQTGSTSAAWKGKPPGGSIPAHMTLSSVLGSGSGSYSGTETNGFLISGSEGVVEFSPADASLTHRDAAGKVLERVKGGPSPFTVTGTYNLACALQRALGPQGDLAALADAATLEDGVATQYVMDAGHESSEAGGKWVKPKLVA